MLTCSIFENYRIVPLRLLLFKINLPKSTSLAPMMATFRQVGALKGQEE